MKQQKLGTKLVVGGFIALAIPIIMIGVVSMYESFKSISQMGKADMINLTESLAATFDIGMREQIITVRNISYTNSVITATEKMAKSGETNSRKEVLLAQREITKMKDAIGDRLSSITLVGKNGIVYASSDNGKFKGLNLAGRNYLEKAFNGTANVGSVVFSRATGRVICIAACPIYDSAGKDITGGVVMAMELKFFSDILDKIKIGETGYTYIVDQNGLYIHHPVKENILKVNISEMMGREAVAEIIGRKKSGVTEYQSNGIRKIGAVVPIPATGWNMVACIPTDELYASARFTRNMIVSIGLAFLIVASVLFYLFARRLTLPLVNVSDAAQRIADGDLTVEIVLESRQDEIGSLSRSFSVMVENLRRQTKGIMEGFSVLSSNVSEIMTTATQVATGTSETAAAISETTTTVEEVRQAAQLSSKKAQNVAESAKSVSQATKTGRKAVEEAAAGMRHISDQMDSIARTVVRLSEQGQAIGGIIASVTDVADQSNLLAVNAAIEAAKAGEQGKGFAVVAQEIRNLAEQSKQATAQVRDILSDVQKATSAAVMATEQGSKAVGLGIKQSEEAGDAIRVLATSSEEAVQVATQIVASSEQQLVGMNQIGVAMENINQASAEAAKSMRQSETAAKDLYELGLKLKQMVEQYKV